MLQEIIDFILFLAFHVWNYKYVYLTVLVVLIIKHLEIIRLRHHNHVLKINWELIRQFQTEMHNEEGEYLSPEEVKERRQFFYLVRLIRVVGLWILEIYLWFKLYDYTGLEYHLWLFLMLYLSALILFHVYHQFVRAYEKDATELTEREKENINAKAFYKSVGYDYDPENPTQKKKKVTEDLNTNTTEDVKEETTEDLKKEKA